MKKLLPYILLIVLCLLATLLYFTSLNTKRFDASVTFNKKSDIPYGTKVLYSMLPILFSKSTIELNRKPPEDWFYNNETEIENTLFIVVTQHFNPNEKELMMLNRFVKKGNQVLIASPVMNADALAFFGVEIANNNFIYNNNYSDSPSVMLRTPVFVKDTTFTYPGFSFESSFTAFNKKALQVLGTTNKDYPNLLKGKVGSGSFYLHSNPFVFSNYFILNKKNSIYIEKLFSAIPATTKRIIWDEYFVYKLQENETPNNPSPLNVILSIPAFKWAFFVALLFLTLFLLLQVKRNQRQIPEIKNVKNESLDFVKTIGRLYFEKQDHLNLANKMSAYFLEHVRSKYFINTTNLNSDFIAKLSGKSGFPETQIEQMVAAILSIQNSNSISQLELTNYYKLFKNFYKTTH